MVISPISLDAHPGQPGGKYLNRLLCGGQLVNEREFEGVSRLSKSAEAFLYSANHEHGGLWLPGSSQAKYSRFRCVKFIDQAVHAECAKAPVKAGRIPVYRGFAVLAERYTNWSETTFVRDGVTLDAEKDLLGFCGLAFVSAAGLQTEITGLNLVRNQAFKDRLELLRPEVEWLLAHDFRPTE